MSVKIPDFREKFSVCFEPPLLDELEEKSMLMEVDAGNTMLNIGQTVRAILLVLKK